MAVPLHWTGRELPLPTIMREVVGVVEESIPELPAMCDEAPVSKSQSVELGRVDCRDSPFRAW